MTQPSSNFKFIGTERDNVLAELASTDKELKEFFKTYLHNEYKGDKAKRLDYVDIGEIARFLVDKLQVGQTQMFQTFFEKVERILNNCDSYVNDLIVVGLFGSIQNICATSIDYHHVFNPWLGHVSKIRWDELIDNWEGEEWRNNLPNNN